MIYLLDGVFFIVLEYYIVQHCSRTNVWLATRRDVSDRIKIQSGDCKCTMRTLNYMYKLCNILSKLSTEKICWYFIHFVGISLDNREFYSRLM